MSARTEAGADRLLASNAVRPIPGEPNAFHVDSEGGEKTYRTIIGVFNAWCDCEARVECKHEIAARRFKNAQAALADGPPLDGQDAT